MDTNTETQRLRERHPEKETDSRTHLHRRTKGQGYAKTWGNTETGTYRHCNTEAHGRPEMHRH